MIIPRHSTKELILKHDAGVMEIRQEPFSKLRLMYFQNGSTSNENSVELRIILDEGADLNCFFGMLGGMASRLVVETRLEGIGSRVRQRTLYFGNGEQSFIMISNTVLSGRETSAEIESKGILAGSSQARFDGNIHIQQTAKQSKGRLDEHTLLLSPHAKMNAIPGLKIDTNDVKATHAASMTRVDDEQLFYAESRGIEEHEAVRLIAEGFLAGLYKDMPFMENMHQLIQEKIWQL
ncbi:SufD family Fe-S cluster assembly protein [Candidatus Peregrinibacteria bacterium]|nr:SufD family Fe-S cluster assembly protein [Candidatus Peregrinibacteria bacterium]